MLHCDEIRDCVVVGAGISGLAAARKISDAGFSVAVVEKSRGVGGRVATRRIDGIPFDHGAQFVTRRDPELGKLLGELVRRDMLSPWFGDPGRERYACEGGMNRMAKYIAEGLQVLRQTRIEAARCEDGIWRLESGQEPIFCRKLLLTNPAPQALDMLREERGRLADKFIGNLTAIDYDMCIAVMARLKVPFRISESGFKSFEHPEPIATVADLSKECGDAHSGIIIHSGPEFAKAHFQDDREAAGRRLLSMVLADFESKALAVSTQGWRYAKRREHNITDAFSYDSQRHLWHAGDGYLAPKIEGAFLSGSRAGEDIVGQLERNRYATLGTCERYGG